jgi:paraquat-inducible protein A
MAGEESARHQMKSSSLTGAALIVAASMAFGFGLALPLFSVQPSAGEWTPVVRLLSGDQLRSSTVTLPGGILALWREGDYFLALLLALFSLMLPAVKLCVLWCEALLITGIHAGVLRFIRTVSKYAMVEVFVIALLVLVIKGLPGGSRITLHAGTYAFSMSVILSLAAGVLLRKTIETAGDKRE